MRLDLAPEAEMAALVRGQVAAESIVVVMVAGGDPLALSLARAALAPLAIEAAPRRLNAVLALPGADPADVADAVEFLDGAASTTGQLIEVSARLVLHSSGARMAPGCR